MNRKLMRPSAGNQKESYGGGSSSGSAQAAHKKPAPPEQTHAENFYFVKQMQARTPVTVILTDGETLHGTIEWYDRNCIKLTRYGSPNLLVYKHAIKYLFKSSEEDARGGSNESTNGDGEHGRSPKPNGT